MSLFDLDSKVAVVTGGSGTLGSSMAKGLYDAGARVCILGRDLAKAQRVAQAITSETDKVLALSADVTKRTEVETAATNILDSFGRVDILVNAAGGNRPDATTNPKQSFFDLSSDAIRAAIDLNLMGSIIPSQVFGSCMAKAKYGSIINISSMAAIRPLTRVVAYAAGKAGLDNFTKWLAVHMAKEYSPAIRVNAMAPGFILAEQNRAMLVDINTGDLTPRGRAIVEHTPMGRFSEAHDLIGTLIWLASDASSYVTGIVVPVDGGFSAYAGV